MKKLMLVIGGDSKKYIKYVSIVLKIDWKSIDKELNQRVAVSEYANFLLLYL